MKINGERHYLWRAVDHEGEVLESFVTETRDRTAALKFLKEAMRKNGQGDDWAETGHPLHPAKKVRLGPKPAEPSMQRKVRKFRNPVIVTGRSERPQWRTFDFSSISASATGIEVFILPVRKAKEFPRDTNSAPNRGSHEVRRISALRECFRAAWRRGQRSARPA